MINLPPPLANIISNSVLIIAILKIDSLPLPGISFKIAFSVILLPNATGMDIFASQ